MKNKVEESDEYVSGFEGDYLSDISDDVIEQMFNGRPLAKKNGLNSSSGKKSI